MKIDNRIEALVREGLDSAVKRDIDRLDGALKAFPDEASRRAGVELLVAICGYAVIDNYHGHRPEDDQIQALSADIAEDEAWAAITTEDVAGFLHWVLGDADTQISPDLGVLMLFVVTASVLAGHPLT